MHLYVNRTRRNIERNVNLLKYTSVCNKSYCDRYICDGLFPVKSKATFGRYCEWLQKSYLKQEIFYCWGIFVTRKEIMSFLTGNEMLGCFALFGYWSMSLISCVEISNVKKILS